jgi:hypothetical protein
MTQDCPRLRSAQSSWRPSLLAPALALTLAACSSAGQTTLTSPIRRSPAITPVAAGPTASGAWLKLPVQAGCGALSAGARPTLRMALTNSNGRPHSELKKIAVTLTAIATIAQTG